MIQKARTDPDRDRLRPVGGRLPPQDLDAEAAVLSAILLAPVQIDQVRFLEPEHFYSDSNRRIFAAVLELDREGRPVDIVSIAARLRDHEQLTQAGGTPYLYQLTDATPALAHVAEHARVVREKSRLRRMIENCHRLAAEGYGDVGDVQSFLEAGENKLAEIAHAGTEGKLVPLARVLDRTHEHLTALKESAAGNGVVGVTSGYVDLDRKTNGLHAGDLTIVAGRPGHGKTSLVLGMLTACAASRAVENSEPTPGRAAALFSLEMPAEQLGMRLIAAESRVLLAAMRRGILSAGDWVRVTDAIGFLSKLPIWIDDSPAPSMAEIRARCRMLQGQLRREQQAPLGLVAVDYLQLVSASVTEKIPREQQVAAISKDSKRMAKDLSVPVVMLSALNRDIEKRGGNKRPQLSDLRESGALEFDADNVFFVHRPEMYDKDSEDRGIAEIIIGKQRNGPTGIVRLRFNGETTRFDNLASDEWSEDFPGAP